MPWNREKFLREVDRSRLTKGALDAAEQRPEQAHRNLLWLLRAGDAPEMQLVNGLWLLHHLLTRCGVSGDFPFTIETIRSVLLKTKSSAVRDAAARVLLIHSMYGIVSPDLPFATSQGYDLAQLISTQQPSLIGHTKYLLELCDQKETGAGET